MFVVHSRRRTKNKINVISVFYNFFVVCLLDAWQRPFALRVTKGARQRPFTVQKSVVPPLPCVFLTFVVRSKRTEKSSFPVVI
jgi:hypothetical protein